MPLEHPRGDKRAEAVRQDVAGDPQVALQLAEAANVEEGLAQDQENPAVAKQIERAFDGVGLEPVLVHRGSVLRSDTVLQLVVN